MKGKVVTVLSILGSIFTIGNSFTSQWSNTLRSNANREGRQSLSSIITRSSSADETEETFIATGDVVKKVAVTGATGKTGKLVVEELIKRNVQVLGLVRNETKAAEQLGDYAVDMLEIQKCNLADPEDIERALVGCDATIWCATGFSDDPASGQMPPTTTMSPEQSIDVIGVPAVARSMINNSGSKKSRLRRVVTWVRNKISKKQKNETQQQNYPKVVMLSSAGTTRVGWNDKKKERLKGCAEIPIVRLNPFGILGLKEESERQLRETGVEYCIVRPCGLNDKWPEGARPVFSQGDVAVGRINRKDLAKILCDTLTLPEACQKTFEVIGLAGYPPPTGIGMALKRLKLDSEDLSESEVEAMYAVAQQLLPGERQDAAALAMGQTYEQLDKGETGRLGERGKENVGAAGIAPTSV